MQINISLHFPPLLLMIVSLRLQVCLTLSNYQYYSCLLVFGKWQNYTLLQYVCSEIYEAWTYRKHWQSLSVAIACRPRCDRNKSNGGIYRCQSNILSESLKSVQLTLRLSKEKRNRIAAWVSTERLSEDESAQTEFFPFIHQTQILFRKENKSFQICRSTFTRMSTLELPQSSSLV